MDGKAWYVVVSLLAGLTIGLPGVGQAAGDEDEVTAAAMLEDGPARPEQLLRVEWVASPGRLGRSRLTGSVHNAHARTALNVQLRLIEIDAAGETVSMVVGPTLESVPGLSQTHFDVQVPDHRRAYQVAVTSFSFDFAEPAAR
jgi:hypothetical protein